MQDAQPMLDLTQKLTEGAVKERIRLLWDELDYNGYARVNSVKKASNLGVASGSLEMCKDIMKLLKYEQYLKGKL